MGDENVLNMSLDDIIKQKGSDAKTRSGPSKLKKQRGRREEDAGRVRIAIAKPSMKRSSRGGLGRQFNQRAEGRRPRAYTNDEVQPRNADAINGDAAWEHDLFDDGQPQARRVRPATQGFKVLITNLDYKVTDEDIQELFENCGTILKSGIMFDRSGRSEEAAEVVFQRREDAMAAVKQYNNLALDNKPMKIELVESTNGGGRMLSSGLRLGGQSNRVQTVRPQRRIQQGSQMTRQNRNTGAKRSNGPAKARGRGAAVSMNDLDKDLDSYMATE